jgi:hypothetical protein
MRVHVNFNEYLQQFTTMLAKFPFDGKTFESYK